MNAASRREAALAGRVLGLLAGAGLAPQRMERRGYDDGAWTPLKLAWPAADIPVVEVSVDPKCDAGWHMPSRRRRRRCATRRWC